MPKIKSMTPGAIAARERRNTEWETKRFNAMMREYIEIKHDAIYDEYCVFYNSVASKYPKKKNLLKTKAFKSWKKDVIEQTFREDGILAEVTDLAGPNDQISEDSDSEFENINDQSRIEQNQTESTVVEGSDILSTAINETLADINELEGADNVVDQIIAELEQDDAIRDIFAGNDDQVQQLIDDEGIVLDYQTELEAVVESFDYELEIDF